MDPPATEFALGRFFLSHLRQLKPRLSRYENHLHEGFATPEDVPASFRRRLEHDERNHRPPACPQQSWNGEGDFVTRVGVVAWMRLGPYRHVLVDAKIEQQLVGVVVLTKRPKGRPLQTGARIRSKIAGEPDLPVFLRHM